MKKRALIITDEPENRSFKTIHNLKQRLERRDNKVDIIAFSTDKTYLNNEKVSRKGGLLDQLTVMLKEGNYSVIVISLKSKYLGQLFLENNDIIKVIRSASPGTVVFVFGASRILGKVKPTQDILLYARSGVAKLTRKISKDVLDYVVSL